MKNKILLPLSVLALITACSNSNVENPPHMMATMNTETDAMAPTTNSPVYKVYKYEVDALICDKSKKGDYTLCDVEGNNITGFVKSEGTRTVAYYENGEQINGIILASDNKTPKTFFKKNSTGDISTVINYYNDGSVKSKEVTNRQSGRTDRFFEKGDKNNRYFDQSQINTLIEVYNKN